MIESNTEPPTVHELGEGLYVRQEIDNMGWMDIGGWLVVVDTLEHPESKDDVLEAIHETVGPDLPVRFVLNTHTHGDHTALNPVFEEMGAQVINLRNTTIPEDGRWFEGVLRRVRMFPVPGCHTPQDCAVWLPDDRVLFVGDLFGWGLVPYDGNLRSDTFHKIVCTYERLIGLDAKHVVPGHGPLMTTNELKRCLEYFRHVTEQCWDLACEDMDFEDIKAAIDPPEDMRGWWRFTEWKHQDSVKKIAKAVVNGWI
jgi:glyoxylase-like metal-dependent hydrolase (beta-lactamase superfamily II)